MSTLTNVPVPRVSREITVAYLGELLFNAGFIDDKQRAEIDKADREFRLAQQRAGSKLRADEDASPFKVIVSMNLTDASGNGTLVLSSEPTGNQQALPADVPTDIAAGTAVSVGDLSGTLATGATRGSHGGCHGEETAITATLSDDAASSATGPR